MPTELLEHCLVDHVHAFAGGQPAGHRLHGHVENGARVWIPYCRSLRSSSEITRTGYDSEPGSRPAPFVVDVDSGERQAALVKVLLVEAGAVR